MTCTTLLNSEECALSEKKKKEENLVRVLIGWAVRANRKTNHVGYQLDKAITLPNNRRVGDIII